jgi:hypothetical protein
VSVFEILQVPLSKPGATRTAEDVALARPCQTITKDTVAPHFHYLQDPTMPFHNNEPHY